MTSIITRLHHITGYGTAARVPDDQLVVVWAKNINEAAETIRELLAALKMTEQSELDHANCQECGGDGEAEACEICFPLADDARIARRIAIAKIEGKSP